MILTYIAGPFSAPTREGVERNIDIAVQWGIQVAKLGAFPVVPHANTSHPDYETAQPYQFWIAGTLALLCVCGACLMVPGWEKSSGATGEKAEAERRGIPVFTDIDALARWFRVIALLSECRRDELRDHAFGDAEITWLRGGEVIATGYYGASGPSVSSETDGERFDFDGDLARPLLKLGTLGMVERNDSQGDDIEF